MYTSKKLLNELKKELKKNEQSYTIYGIAKRLEVARPTIDRWAQGRTMDDENAIKIAEFLNIDPAYVIACIHAERAKGSDSYATWEKILEKFEENKSKIKAA